MYFRKMTRDMKQTKEVDRIIKKKSKKWNRKYSRNAPYK